MRNKWELIRWGFEAIQDAIYFRFTLEDNIDRLAFFECLSKGWCDMYIWSDYESKCIKYFGVKPEKVYVSQEAYDELVKRINEPPDPKVKERLREILEKKSPWDVE